jgi:hypothetical protein
MFNDSICAGAYVSELDWDRLKQPSRVWVVTNQPDQWSLSYLWSTGLVHQLVSKELYSTPKEHTPSQETLYSPQWR